MSKFSRLLVIVLALIALTPVTRAENDQPIKIKSATVETKDSRVIGEVKVCNSERERVKFVLDIKNLTINSIYKRSLSIDKGDCDTIKLRFTKDFGEMSNVGDEIEIVAKAVSGLGLNDEYDFSNTYTTKVTKGTEDKAGCADQFGDDGIFNACENDFIYHEPSGLRIKVMSNTSEYVDLKLIHVEWGGVKDMRIYKGRTKKVRSNFDELKRVEITNAYGDNSRDLLIKIESSK
jgi:hypothetical protein